MLHPRGYQGTGIETLPPNVQEDIARRTCPYTIDPVFDAIPMGLNVHLSGGTVYLRVPSGSAKKLKAFSARVRKTERGRWRGESIDTFNVHLPNLVLRYENGSVYVFYMKMIFAAIDACPLLLDHLDNLAKHL